MLAAGLGATEAAALPLAAGLAEAAALPALAAGLAAADEGVALVDAEGATATGLLVGDVLELAGAALPPQPASATPRANVIRSFRVITPA